MNPASTRTRRDSFLITATGAPLCAPLGDCCAVVSCPGGGGGAVCPQAGTLAARKRRAAPPISGQILNIESSVRFMTPPHLERNLHCTGSCAQKFGLRIAHHKPHHIGSRLHV